MDCREVGDKKAGAGPGATGSAEHRSAGANRRLRATLQCFGRPVERTHRPSSGMLELVQEAAEVQAKLEERAHENFQQTERARLRKRPPAELRQKAGQERPGLGRNLGCRNTGLGVQSPRHGLG